MPGILDSANLLVSLASTGFGVAALVRPAWHTGSCPVGPGEIFYARMYAARAIPFGLLTGVLPFCCPGRAAAFLLFVAAVVQLADGMIGAAKRERGMMIGPPIAALVHLLCGFSQMRVIPMF